MTNGVDLLFGRLRKRAEITDQQVGPSLLRDTYAMRYLQAGGNPFLLQELLGHEQMTAVKRYLQRNDQMRKDQKHNERSGDHLPRRTVARTT